MQRTTDKRPRGKHAAVYSVAGEAAAMLVVILGASMLSAAKSPNDNSAVGTNLTQVSYWSTEQPFLDLVKSAHGFDTVTSPPVSTTGEEKCLDLDEDGWPKSLVATRCPSPQRFSEARIILRPQLVSTKIGGEQSIRFTVLYEGQGTIAYSDAARKDLLRSKPGRDVLDVKRDQYGSSFILTIRQTDPEATGNYIRNIRVVRTDQEAALVKGQVFNPRFLEAIRNYRALRFMDWSNTNGSQQSKWAGRPKVSNAHWSSAAGVPYEIMLQLANAASAEPWLNLPAMADDDYIGELAGLAHAQLDPTLNVYVELSNETWNTGFSQTAWMTAQGRAAFPSAPEYLQNRNWYGMRTAQMCDIWKSVWAKDSGRVICVLAAQAANPSTAIDALNCKAWIKGAPCSAHGIGALAIAPYFGYSAPNSWTSQPDGGLSSLFESLYIQNDKASPQGGWIHQSLDWVATYAHVAANYRLPLIAYEGGQSFVSFPHGLNPDGSNNGLTQLYLNANRDVRMETAYRKYLEGWRTNGGQIYMNFTDVGPYNQYGEWGALESIDQTINPLSDAPPKWRALENFITENPCWWSHCGRATVAP